jgi:hypothetical protein
VSSTNQETSEFSGAKEATALTPEIEVFFGDQNIGEFELPETHR